MTERGPIKDVQGRPPPDGWSPAVFVPVLLALATATACSGGSSKDEPQTVDDPVEEVMDDDGVDDGADDGDADNPVDRDTLVRQLDRLIAATDADLLRLGLPADAASPSLGTLETRLESAQRRLREMRPPAEAAFAGGER